MAPEELPRRYYDDREDITEEYSFDTLAKGAADGTISRAKAIKLAAMALLGSALALFLPAEEAGANHTRRHRRRQRRRRRCLRRGTNCEAACPGNTRRTCRRCCTGECNQVDRCCLPTGSPCSLADPGICCSQACNGATGCI